MTDWQITAKTIFCEAVDDEVTILIFKDGKLNCTGYKKYTEPNELTSALVKEKHRKTHKRIKCEGEKCPRVSDYHKSILAEDSK